MASMNGRKPTNEVCDERDDGTFVVSTISPREQLETDMRQAIASIGYTDALRLISEMMRADSADHMHDADEDDAIEDGAGDESRTIACDLADFADEVGDMADRYETWQVTS